jgi:hypothetical protein
VVNSDIEAERDHFRVGGHFVRVFTMKEAILEPRPLVLDPLMELLRPPIGCKLDIAVGTAYSLDLISALMLPLSFASFDWQHADGGLVADPLALLEALRRYGDRFTIFCQSGQMKLPSKYPPLVTFLEPCVYDVEPPDQEGVSIPKSGPCALLGTMTRSAIECCASAGI